MKGKIVIKYNT